MEDRNYLEEYLNGISALESMETGRTEGGHAFCDPEVIKDAKRGIASAVSAKDSRACKAVCGAGGVMLEDLIGEGNMALLEATGQMECLDTDGDILEETEGFLGNI